MQSYIRRGLAIILAVLALIALPAAASDTSAVQPTANAGGLAAGLASDNLADARLLMLDRVLYPTSYDDHAYMCAEGNCTDW